MSVLDKFLSIMRLDDEDDFEDDLFDEDDEFEETPKKNFFKKNKKSDYDDDEDLTTDKKTNNSGSKVTPMRPVTRKGNSMEVCVIKPISVDESREITETLLSGRTVILNLEGLDLEVAQRIIDFTSGATFAIRGNLQKISTYIFLVTPTNVDISGDLQDLLNTSFDTPTLKMRY